jgi:hypothetical protein
MCPRAPHLALLEQFCADLVQPAIGGIVMEAGVPVLLDREAGNGNWTGQHFKPVNLGQSLADVARQGRDQVRRADDRRQTQKSGQFRREAPVDPLLLHRCRQQLRPRAGDDADVLLFLVGLDRQSIPHARMRCIEHADPVLGIQRLLEEAPLKIGDQPERKIGLAGLRGAGGFGVDLRRLDADMRGRGADMAQYVRQQSDVTAVGHADAKPPLRSGR